MMAPFITEYPQFFTATIKDWKHLLKKDEYKDIIIESLRFLVKHQRIKLSSFVIMVNHLHLIWQMLPSIHGKNVQRDFLKFIGQSIKFDLIKTDPIFLDEFWVGANDRSYQFWERRPLSVELRTDNIYQQKLNYIHYNPIRAGLCRFPEEYKYSSASFYHTGIDNWGFLSHYRD